MIIALSVYYVLLCSAIPALAAFGQHCPILSHPVVWPIALGGMGSVIYCVRAIYHHRCVTRDWDSSWYAWYWLRPFAGLLTGAVAFIMVQAGLVLLNAESDKQGNAYGLYAIAVIAGYNVDQFWALIERVMKNALGIEPSRLGKKEKENE